MLNVFGQIATFWEIIIKKKKELGPKYKKMYWLMGRRSALSIHNKLMLYKQILKPMWTYGIQLWGCTRQSNLLTYSMMQSPS